jgi:uncharacterized protein YggU (UPF0235/DUF167 family)
MAWTGGVDWGRSPWPSGGACALALRGRIWEHARMAKDEKGKWADLAVSGAEFAAHVTPRARRNAAELRGGVFYIQTTTAPEDGRATAAVAQALAHGLGVAKTRLVLVRGAASRDKVFRLE